MYELWNLSLWNFLHSPAISLPFLTSILMLSSHVYLGL
jgi:hypothetical protein